MIKNILLALSLSISSSYAADIVLIAKGSEENIITQDAYPEMRFSESMLTQTALSLLATNLSLSGKNIAVTDEALAEALGQQGLWISSDTQNCQVALELHFDPKHTPNGSGKGLWIGGDKAHQVLVEKILANFSKKEAVYSSTLIDNVQPETTLDCPVLYINLDTDVQDGESLWFIQPQAIMHYTKKLGDSVIEALKQ